MTEEASTHRDPRSVVTPDAFQVDEALLGLPLAPPMRRLAALLIDLLVIGFVTLVTRSFALVLGVVAAAFFMRAGFRRTPVRGNVFGRAMRLSVGCLGVWIAMVTAVLWSSCGSSGGGDDDDTVSGVVQGLGGSFLPGLAVRSAFENAESLEEAEDAVSTLLEVAGDVGLDRDEVRDALEDGVPEDADWAAEAPAMFDRMLAAAYATPEATPAEAAAEEVVDALSDEVALSEYARLSRADTADPEVAATLAALRRRLAGVVAADSLGLLADRIDDLERSYQDERERAESARVALRDATSGGLLSGLRSLVDELGFGFGWASLYLTVFLSWWNGQTVGKRLLGLRVMRLDGEPITWWVAFERAGGYAAGFATGLLGFAQVYWDANRQAIHDRIVGTVVVLNDREKVTDWESAL